MKRFFLTSMLFIALTGLYGAEVFVLKAEKFKYPGVVEVLKKVLSAGEAALAADTAKVEITAGTIADANLAEIFKKHLNKRRCGCLLRRASHRGDKRTQQPIFCGE